MTAKKLLAEGSRDVTRRQFIAGAGLTTLGLTLLKPDLLRGAEANSKINIGLIGCGGRGQWIAKLFAQNGGFNVMAAADYFQDRVEAVAKDHNIPAAGCFAGLNGYQRLLEQKLDAVIVQTPPYFHPPQVAAAIEAGKHVYVAKPLAVDVPGCQSIAESGRKATAKKLALQVDFQTRANPAYQEVLKRVHDGAIGKLVTIFAEYQTNLMFQERDNQVRKAPNNPEVRLRAWGIDRLLSGDVITEQNIHALDVAAWFANADPIKAYGTGGRARPFLGDCWDHYSVLFFFPDDLVVNFCAKQVGYGYDDIMCRAHGMTGTAETHYGGKVWLRSREDAYNGDSPNIYVTGPQANIATFYDHITKGDFSNPTVAPSVRSNLTTILGRTAAYKKTEVTWAEIMKANEKWEFDTKGLKV
ncbi:MAG: Gfo/Idh/MocA family oxidoreductase [Verrucomicrobia bacterium]|nr:Gfo/Idh/MocA family oxidoreductase [Verrucomicrobiota bacterium]